eukprot:2638690-Pleurochrysis_carterae.AAC.1
MTNVREVQRYVQQPKRRVGVSRAAGRSETWRLLAGRWMSLLLPPMHGAAPLAPTHCGSTA